MNDAQLVRRVLAGDREAYAVLVDRYAGSVRAVCQAIVRRAGAAEDLGQEAFLRGLRDLPSLKHPDRFRFWLHGIARNVCHAWLGDRDNNPNPLPDNLTEGEEGGSSQAERADEGAVVRAAVEKLPEECRLVVWLRYADDLSHQEIAARLGSPLPRVNYLLTRARQLLHDLLQRPFAQE